MRDLLRRRLCATVATAIVAVAYCQSLPAQVGAASKASTAVVAVDSKSGASATIASVSAKPEKPKLPTFILVGGEREIAAHEAILKALDQDITLSMRDVPLTDFTEYLAKVLGVHVHVDRKAIEDANLKVDLSVTCEIKNISGRSALNQILKDVELGWTIANESLVITSKEGASNTSEVRIYPVGDLLDAIDENGVRSLAWDSMIELIKSSITPESWDDVGGHGTIHGNDKSGSLVVSQTLETHEKIAQLLEGLRKARKMSLDQ